MTVRYIVLCTVHLLLRVGRLDYTYQVAGYDRNIE